MYRHSEFDRRLLKRTEVSSEKQGRIMWKSNYYENDISYIIVFIVTYTDYHQITEIIFETQSSRDFIYNFISMYLIMFAIGYINKKIFS